MNATTQPPAPLTTTITHSSGTVLVADDDFGFRETTCDLLREAGYQAEGVADAPSAEARLNAGTFDLLVTDIRMPGSVELEYLRDANRGRPRIPIIVVTGYPSVETAGKALQLPVVSYLVKPFEVESFIAEVRRAVALRRIQIAIESASKQAHTLESHLNAAGSMLAENPRASTASETASHLAQLLFNDVRRTLESLEQFYEAAIQSGTVGGASSTPFRPLALVEVLQEAVIAIEKSKSDFKSKELGDLRMKIEKLLKAD